MGAELSAVVGEVGVYSFQEPSAVVAVREDGRRGSERAYVLVHERVPLVSRCHAQWVGSVGARDAPGEIDS